MDITIDKDGILTIKIDTRNVKQRRISASGKTWFLASTRGYEQLTRGMRLELNLVQPIT